MEIYNWQNEIMPIQESFLLETVPLMESYPITTEPFHMTPLLELEPISTVIQGNEFQYLL